MTRMVQGKVALLTGAGGDIALEITRELLRHGLKCASLLDINEDYLQNVKEKIENEFGRNKVHIIKTDVCDQDQVKAAFEETIKMFNQLDIVINNAGIADDINFQKTININCGGVVTGTLLAINEYLPKYKNGNEAYVINTSSIFGLYPFPGLPVYSGTKCFVIGFTQAIGAQVHYERTKIKVLAICPGLTTTRLSSSWKSLNKESTEMCENQMKVVKLQTPCHVGKELITVLNKGKSGSIWVIEENKPATEIESRKGFQ